MALPVPETQVIATLASAKAAPVAAVPEMLNSVTCGEVVSGVEEPPPPHATSSIEVRKSPINFIYIPVLFISALIRRTE